VALVSSAGRYGRRGARRLRQRNALERADYVVRAAFSEEAFVVAGTEVPIRALVVVVAIKSPDTVYNDETTDAVVPVISDVMKTQVRPREGALESNVIVKHQFGQADCLRHKRHLLFPSRGGVIAQRTKFPFHVDDAAVVRRQFSFGYSWHKRGRQWFLQFDQMKSVLSSKEI